MPNQEKLVAVDELVDRFTGSSATVITHYRGLTTAQLGQLREALGSGVTYMVVKNTLARWAAIQANVYIEIDGPTAIAFIQDDPIPACRTLRDFTRSTPLIITAGVLDGQVVSAVDVAKLAEFGSRDALLARLVGVLKAMPTHAAASFAALIKEKS